MKFNKFILAVLTVAALLFFFSEPARAQLTPTIVKPVLTNTVTCLSTVSNLAPALLITNNFTPGRHLGLGVVFCGSDATNTGVVGFRLNAMFAGTNNLKTTTTPFTLTSTANGTTVVRDWLPLADYTTGPCDGFVLGTITNAAANVAATATGSLVVSNAWLEYR